jgi:hypothetical protein
MAKAKTTKPPKANAWLKLPSGWGLPALVFAPAELAVRWRGRGGDRIRFTFQYWQKIVAQLPDGLRPTAGHPDTPHLTVDSPAEAKALVEKLRQFVATLHPTVTVKKQKNLDLTRFMSDDGADYRLIINEQSAANDAFDTIDRSSLDAWRWPLGDAEVLMWQVGRYGVRVRATSDEILFVDHQSGFDEANLDLTGDATSHGTWSFEKLLVGMWVSLAVTDLKGVTSGDVAALAPLVNTVVKAKKSEEGSGVILPAEGRYRVETGGSSGTPGGLRWLRFIRE